MHALYKLVGVIALMRKGEKILRERQASREKLIEPNKQHILYRRWNCDHISILNGLFVLRSTVFLCQCPNYILINCPDSGVDCMNFCKTLAL
jgi:hypothetical protein